MTRLTHTCLLLLTIGSCGLLSAIPLHAGEGTKEIGLVWLYGYLGEDAFTYGNVELVAVRPGLIRFKAGEREIEFSGRFMVRQGAYKKEKKWWQFAASEGLDRNRPQFPVCRKRNSRGRSHPHRTVYPVARIQSHRQGQSQPMKRGTGPGRPHRKAGQSRPVARVAGRQRRARTGILRAVRHKTRPNAPKARQRAGNQAVT